MLEMAGASHCEASAVPVVVSAAAAALLNTNILMNDKALSQVTDDFIYAHAP